MKKRPLLAVVGATGTGKSEVALAAAQALQGEVVSADAYQLYRGMDIGTAKVGELERGRVRHHLIDVTGPDDAFSLARYVDAAHAAFDDIWSRGRLPVFSGGSGQYFWAVIEGWQVPRLPPDHELRRRLEAQAETDGPESLHRRLQELDRDAASRLDPRNTRRLVRALELVLRTGLPLSACQTRRPIDAGVFIVGLWLERDELYRRLDERTDAMFAAGFIDEVRRLRAHGFGESTPLRGAIGYKEVSLYLDGGLSLDEAVRRMKNANHRLVRRQGAWFRREDSRIHWLEAGPGAAEVCVAVTKAWLQSETKDA